MLGRLGSKCNAKQWKGDFATALSIVFETPTPP
jgi:hypothetical protein